MSKFDQIAARIIKEQELIIGPLAWSEAETIDGLTVLDKKAGALSIDDAAAPQVIDELVSRYESLFGRASREVCKEAAAPLIADFAPAEVPTSLK